MKQDMNMDLGLESFLEPDSDFIEELCDHLEAEGIHLTNELLVQILSKYEDHKFNFFKELIEQLVGPDQMGLSTDGNPAVIQVVMDGKRHKKQKNKEEDPLIDMDSTLLS
ncbi:hypothetical protein [Turicibacter sp. TJ11]|uniref:hypothetical protein n=1 Tax=Turicibacter sp. TJ11 TaxID=2806443 RepID=UPI001F1C8BC4|nr:hypothetical protein [Turicibacter sp. TJ11]